jgi:hypothetical protein
MNATFPIYYETLGHSENPCILLVNGLGRQLIHWPTAFTEDLVKQGFYTDAHCLTRSAATLLPDAHLEIIEKMGHGLPECLCKKIIKLIADFYAELPR